MTEKQKSYTRPSSAPPTKKTKRAPSPPRSAAKARVAKTKVCPSCDGCGYKNVGRSLAMNAAIAHGYPSTYECECCGGKGRIPVDLDPDWWKVSDNERPGR